MKYLIFHAFYALIKILIRIINRKMNTVDSMQGALGPKLKLYNVKITRQLMSYFHRSVTSNLGNLLT